MSKELLMNARSCHPRWFWKPHALFAAALIGAVCLSGCGSTAPRRPTLNDEQLLAKAEAEAQETARVFRELIGRLIERAEREVSEQGDDATIDILAISGGGDHGAFGAGFLNGWGSVEIPEWHRPEFDVVTGVSTGALLAPFAFVGTDDAIRRVEDFYRDPRKDWVRDRGLLFFLPGNPSFMTIAGLERDIRGVFDSAFIGSIADRYAKGAALIVSATDLDLGRQTYWNLGEEAKHAVVSGDEDRLERILMASAAIPGVFPPIMIGDSAYADGGVTANVLLRLDSRHPDAFIPRWKAAHPGKPLPRVRYWVIINSQLSQQPATVQPTWPSVLSPSISTAIRSATIAEVRWLAAQADYINATEGTDIEVRVVAIPDEWRAPVKGEFKKETMVSLSDLGRSMGAEPASWVLWATPGP